MGCTLYCEWISTPGLTHDMVLTHNFHVNYSLTARCSAVEYLLGSWTSFPLAKSRRLPTTRTSLPAPPWRAATRGPPPAPAVLFSHARIKLQAEWSRCQHYVSGIRTRCYAPAPYIPHHRDVLATGKILAFQAFKRSHGSA